MGAISVFAACFESVNSVKARFCDLESIFESEFREACRLKLQNLSLEMQQEAMWGAKAQCISRAEVLGVGAARGS